MAAAAASDVLAADRTFPPTIYESVAAFEAGKDLPGLPNLAKPIYVVDGSAVCDSPDGVALGQPRAQYWAKVKGAGCVIVPRVQVKVVAHPDNQDDYGWGFMFGVVQVLIERPPSSNMSEARRDVFVAWTTIDVLEGTSATVKAKPERLGPSSDYAGRIGARIKPNLVVTTNIEGNPLATVEVRLAPDGRIIGRKLVRSSGSAAWDETVLRAIDKTEILPRDVDGRVPSSMMIEFRPAQ